MAPLPRELPQGKKENPHVLSAYNRCLMVELSVSQNPGNLNDAKVAKLLICARILGYLLHHVPSEEGLKTVVEEILSCHTDEAVLQLGLMYLNHYIMAFRANKGRTPTPSNHASRPSFDTVADMMNDTLHNAPQSRTTAKIKALFREEYRCVVTKKYDIFSLIKIREVNDRMNSDPSGSRDRGSTECTHIFAESTNADIELGSERVSNPTTIWDIMMRFGYKTLPEDLNGSKVHRLENVMTLEKSIHDAFDNLYIWFVQVENQGNTYKLESAYPDVYDNLPEFVTFTTPDSHEYPVPSPIYLAVHAACAKVAHLSGAGEYIDKLYCDMEAGTTLNADGSSADMLEHALSLLR